MRALALAGCVPAATAASLASSYSLRESYVGADFFEKWEFFEEPDPSNGAVEYVGREAAASAGLIRTSASHVYLGADRESAPVEGQGRRSIRIQSAATYNGGLFVAAIDHMPEGCATWPAFWMYGDDPEHPWPQWGEYDILEAVNGQQQAMTTLHTSAGCTQLGVMAGQDFSGAWDVGQRPDVPALDCDVNATLQWPNQGCAQAGPPESAGAAFNTNGGGTFAAEWDPVGQRIRTWFWRSGYEPVDVARGQPYPETWGTPYSYFSLAPELCPARHFTNMRLVFNINFCGDRGGAAFALTCPEAAKEMTCREFAETRDEAAAQAYWSIRLLDVYQQEPPSRASPLGWLLSLALIVVPLCALVGVAYAGGVRIGDWDPRGGGNYESRFIDDDDAGWTSGSPANSGCMPFRMPLAIPNNGYSLGVEGKKPKVIVCL